MLTFFPKWILYAIGFFCIGLFVFFIFQRSEQPLPLLPVENNKPGEVLAQKPFLHPGPARFAKPEPALGSMIVLAKELGSSESFISYNADLRWPIASITKLMSALVASQVYSSSSEILISESAVALEGIAGGFKAGELYSVSDLLKALLSVSSNDAAAALAEGYGFERFIQGMNDQAKRLQMTQTTFADPSGLSIYNQSTAQDLEKLIISLSYMHPELLAITREGQVEITEKTSTLKRKLTAINQFAGTEGFLGGKTGFTDEANGNLVSLFRIHDRPFLIIVMGTGDRFGETEKIRDWLTVVIANIANLTKSSE